MQSIVISLPDEKSIISFVCRGLLDIPGVTGVHYHETPQEQADSSTVRIPLFIGETYQGVLSFTIDAPEVFAPYWDYLRNFCYVLAVILEERRQRRESSRLEAENRQLQKAESLGRMAGAIAHIFNNQLAVVMGNLEMALMELPRDAAIRGELIEAMRAARRSADVSGLMLTYLGQSAGKPEPLDLLEVCRQNLPMLQDAMPEGIALKTALLSSGPVVCAHASQIQQVLTHLITNGWESIGHAAGTVTLATRIIPASEIPTYHLASVGWKPEADVFSCLEVTDTGCGIAEDDLDKIFDPFFTTKFTGRGLGLAVVLGIVKTWGGSIGVESKREQGSTFRVFLPLVTDELPRPSGKAAEAL
jgi:signal transduction histidine kinase